jgi:YD repeat-containing protein
MGRLSQYTLPRGGVQKTTYDPAGNVISVLGPRALATYNADGQVATLTQSPAGNTTTFGYDNAGRLSSAALARNGSTVSTTTYGWDADSMAGTGCGAPRGSGR